MRMRAIIVAGLLAGVAGACSAGRPGAGPAPRRSSVITRAELDRVPGASVFDAVQQLRPTWLSRPTAPTLNGDNPVMAYVDGQQFGTVADLRGLPTEQVERIEFISASDATTRFGTGHPSGAILVTTKGH
jgi:TonB-dependent Receptor Plug Domain